MQRASVDRLELNEASDRWDAGAFQVPGGRLSVLTGLKRAAVSGRNSVTQRTHQLDLSVGLWIQMRAHTARTTRPVQNVFRACLVHV